MNSRFESRLGRYDKIEVDSADVGSSWQIVLMSQRWRVEKGDARGEAGRAENP